MRRFDSFTVFFSMFVCVFVVVLVWFGLVGWFFCLFNLFFHEVYRKLSKKLTAILSRQKNTLNFQEE